jgi:serine/threonine-protein kinase RIO1
MNCRDYFSGGAAREEEKRAAAKSVVQLLQAMWRCKLSHGDLKATNIIIGAAHPVLLDLDAMREHAGNTSSSRARERDRARFLRNWNEDPPTRRLFEELLAEPDSR